eukprot:PhM_4_TR15088/c0_g1_i1/m.53237
MGCCSSKNSADVSNSAGIDSAVGPGLGSIINGNNLSKPSRPVLRLGADTKASIVNMCDGLVERVFVRNAAKVAAESASPATKKHNAATESSPNHHHHHHTVLGDTTFLHSVVFIGGETANACWICYQHDKPSEEDMTLDSATVSIPDSLLLLTALNNSNSVSSLHVRHSKALQCVYPISEALWVSITFGFYDDVSAGAVDTSLIDAALLEDVQVMRGMLRE